MWTDRMNVDARLDGDLAQLARVLDSRRPTSQRTKALATILRTLDEDS